MTPALVRSIPFFDYTHAFRQEEVQIMAILRDTARRGGFILQAELEKFESNLARYLGVSDVAGVGNATDGLTLALRACGIGPGAEVIFCSHTMCATAAAIHFAGATPIPVECGPDHLIAPECIEESITRRTRAILPTQLNGRVAEMDVIRAIAQRHGLLIIEDAAQAVGARFRGEAAGALGTAGVFSFYPSKILASLGDGGAVVSTDPFVARSIRLLRDHGRDEKGDIVAWGMNSRLDNLQAAILDYRLNSLDAAIAHRRALASVYQERLSWLDELTLPPGPDDDPDHFDVYQNYEIEADHRDRLESHLKAHGIGTLRPWGGRAVHQWPKLGLKAQLPRTEALFERVLLLPMNTSLTEDSVHSVCDRIESFYRG